MAETRQRLEQTWLEENIAAASAYNEHIASNGVFSKGLRNF
ncbi:MAG: type II toxin-antitoxin system CcdA family antitoxin [Gammaproteobacteria bacterium]